MEFVFHNKVDQFDWKRHFIALKCIYIEYVWTGENV